jgi:transposase
MAKQLLPDALWARIAPLLPPEPPKPKGGRPRVSDRAALTGILFVLTTGIPWEYLPAEMGWGSGMTCWRRLRDWYQAGVWRRLHQVLLVPSPPSGPAQAPHHPPHRPLGCRAQEPPGTLPVGGRTDALLAQPLPAPEDPLRAPG